MTDMIVDAGFGLTPRQRLVLDFINDHMLTSGGVCPSLTQIAAGVGVKTASTIHRMLQDMEARGWVSRTPNVPRSLRVIRHPPVAKQ